MIEAWGPAGLEAHTKTMQRSYQRRAQVVLAAAGERVVLPASFLQFDTRKRFGTLRTL